MIQQLDHGLDSLRVIGQYPALDGPAKWLLQHVLPLMGRYEPLINFVNRHRGNEVFSFSGHVACRGSDIRRLPTAPDLDHEHVRARYDPSTKRLRSWGPGGAQTAGEADAIIL
jgi:hypothetical protein